MAKEVLVIPESQLADVVRVIRTGIFMTWRSHISPETRAMLLAWCDEEEQYLARCKEK